MSFLLNIYHFGLAFLGALIYRFPGRRIFVVGVTGTKGKSTTIEIMSALMEAAGKRTALISSVRRKIGERSEKSDGNTMPGRFRLQRFLREAIRAGCNYAFVEVTSQGVRQFRHKFIDWDAAMITNLAPEHIEAHGSFEAYKKAKLDFFWAVAGSRKKETLFFIGGGENLADFEKAAKEANGAKVFLIGGQEFLGEFEKNCGWTLEKLEEENRWLSADFNLENAAFAVSFARYEGVSWEDICGALRSFKGVPGRLDFVQREPFAVVIDYAHTPDSLKKVYTFLRESELPTGRLICVLGSAGGGRDRWKRPFMGRIAGEFCDEVILTNEGPYDESPSQILSEVKSGMSDVKCQMSNVYEILDRREAIGKAISLAREGDAVVLTGKGSEQWIHLAGGKKMAWSEREEAVRAFRDN